MATFSSVCSVHHSEQTTALLDQLVVSLILYLEHGHCEQPGLQPHQNATKYSGAWRWPIVSFHGAADESAIRLRHTAIKYKSVNRWRSIFLIGQCNYVSMSWSHNDSTSWYYAHQYASMAEPPHDSRPATLPPRLRNPDITSPSRFEHAKDDPDPQGAKLRTSMKTP
jgi:hypothetical protein